VGWPVALSDIEPWYPRACELLSCGDPVFRKDEWAAQIADKRIDVGRLERFSNRPKMQVAHRQALQSNPLIDLRLTRRMCHDIIADAGLPDPPKSSCYFCPFHSPKAWMTLRAEHPDLFAKAVELETRLNVKRNAEGRDIVRLHPSLLPLDRAVADQPMLWDEMSVCESGFCFT